MRRIARAIGSALLVPVALIGLAILVIGYARSLDAPPRPTTGAPRTDTHEQVAAAPLARSIPTGVEIPRLGLRAPVMPIGTREDGTVQSPGPERTDTAGWYRFGPTPGEPGNSVVVGHLDDRDGPAIFYRLATLARGEQIRITRTDGRVAVFAIDAVHTFDRQGFPTELVYGPNPRAELRLITCGGDYRRGSGYSENVVVFASLLGRL